MAMTTAFRNAVADYGGSLITHIGLVDDTGTELSGGSPAYARKAVSWTTATGGVIRPTTDLVFDVGPGKNVAGWRGYNAATGGTNYGGESLTKETFAGQGTYKLLAAGTGIQILDAS
jgi:hypothetical protein